MRELPDPKIVAAAMYGTDVQPYEILIQFGWPYDARQAVDIDVGFNGTWHWCDSPEAKWGREVRSLVGKNSTS